MSGKLDTTTNNYYYVDKTRFIKEINDGSKYYFLILSQIWSIF